MMYDDDDRKDREWAQAVFALAERRLAVPPPPGWADIERGAQEPERRSNRAAVLVAASMCAVVLVVWLVADGGLFGPSRPGPPGERRSASVASAPAPAADPLARMPAVVSPESPPTGDLGKAPEPVAHAAAKSRAHADHQAKAPPSVVLAVSTREDPGGGATIGHGFARWPYEPARQR